MLTDNLNQRHYDMIRRCYNPNCANYKHYGARGITVCDDWRGEFGLNNFRKWALTNGYSKELSLDKIDNDGQYSPENCRWTTRREQNINKRPSIKGSTGFVGINIHSSSYEGHIYYYGRVRVESGKTMCTGNSSSLKLAIIMRNNFIIENKLTNKLNVIPIDMED